MKKSFIRPLILIGCLLAVTIGTLAYTAGDKTPAPAPRPTPTPMAPTPNPAPAAAHNGILKLTAGLTQSKVLVGSDGLVSLALTLSADQVSETAAAGSSVDMVIVLDRSGSMAGQKIDYAKKAILDLLGHLTPMDRIALVSYSDNVRRHSGLIPATGSNIELLTAEVRRITPDASTNLGAGLQEGLDVLTSSPRSGQLGKVVLISDGLANRGIVDPAALGRMAASAVAKELSVSTIGVGLDFNEQLMAGLADQGAGNYYFLDNPAAFSQVFQKEFIHAKLAAATAIAVKVPLNNGVALMDAAGFPIEVQDGQAVFRPGDIRAGATRKFYLTLRVPTSETRTVEIGAPSATYLHQGQPLTVTVPQPLTLACVGNKDEVLASYDQDEWGNKVVQEDFGKLREEVSKDIKEGRRDEAMKKIDGYRANQQEINARVGSKKVESNLNEDLRQLGETVTDSFTGAPAEREMKQKANSKSMQSDGYSIRRAK